MTSPTHDAIGATSAFVGYEALTHSTPDPRGLIVALGCIVLLGVRGYWASRKQRRREAPLKVARRNLVVGGMSAKDALREIPKPRWDGPSRKASRPLRALAIGCACLTAWPVAVALASSRLPDQLEVGKIDHRKLTHWVVTGALLVLAVWASLCQVHASQAETVAGIVALAVAVGYGMHLIADGCTLSGVPFLGPFYREDLHLLPKRMRVRTGSTVDLLIMFACCGVVVASTISPGSIRAAVSLLS